MAAGDRNAAKQLAAKIDRLFESLRVNQRSVTGDLNGLRLRADLERDVHGHIETSANNQSNANKFFKTRVLGFQCVVVRRGQFQQTIVSLIVGDGLEGASDCGAMGNKLDAKQGGSGIVCYVTIDAAIGRGLR